MHSVHAQAQHTKAERSISGHFCSTSGPHKPPPSLENGRKRRASQQPGHARISLAWTCTHQCQRTRPLPTTTAAALPFDDRGGGGGGAEDAGPLPFSPENLVSLMEKMADSGVHADDMPEADWLRAAAVAAAPQASVAQVARLLQAAAVLQFDPAAPSSTSGSPSSHAHSSSSDGSSGSQHSDSWVAFVLRACQGKFKDTDASSLLDLLTMLLLLQQQLLLQQAEAGTDPTEFVLLTPGADWLGEAVTQIASRTDDLSAASAAGAVIVATELLSLTPAPLEPPNLWLDALLLRVSESDVHSVPSSDLLTCTYLVASTHKHRPPQAFVQAVFGDEGACYRPDWGPGEAAAMAIACASFRHVPDLLWAKQVQMQVFPGLHGMPEELLAELAWAFGCWQALKASTPKARYDYRPPSSWWDEWFQATAPALRVLPPASCLRLIWAAAMLELRPPEQWLQQLVSAVNLHVQAGQQDALEMLYLTKAADLWWSQLLDNSRALSGGSTNEGPASVVIMCGGSRQEPYEPPDELSLLVQGAYTSLSQAGLPPQLWALDIRASPPYGLTDMDGVAHDLLGSNSLESLGTIGPAQLMSAAARRVYGPVAPPR